MHLKLLRGINKKMQTILKTLIIIAKIALTKELSESVTWNCRCSTLHSREKSIKYSLTSEKRIISWQFFGARSRLTYRPNLWRRIHHYHFMELINMIELNSFLTPSLFCFTYLHKCILCFFTIKFGLKNFIFNCIVARWSKVCYCSSCFGR